MTLAPGEQTRDDADDRGRSTSDGSARQEETLRQARRLRRSLGHSDAPLPATVRAARLGSVGLVGLPGEPFLGLRSRAVETLGGEQVLLLGYVGGYVGYLPTREAFAGEPTYETVISAVAAGEPERLVDTGTGLLSLLGQNSAS
ncbi:MAG: hypothetical protein GEV28_15295 [Actinophytocola sp.]|uniref:hypothetical protein n=1 Tax=Actinophytocola sp. TaxID=1872138 RepID=UPI0013285AFA|nr:hypothetical protein [Actinophytocola sp.]MPZ81685.1 hypothetical protein [Actinophytocola sp.]